MVGRSNVGKSSFINSLTRRKSLAKTSNTPGKTRLINFYNINEALILVDLPGYGYAKVSQSEQEKWRKNLEAYLSKRSAIRLVMQLIDARHGPQPSDLQMLQWLSHQQLPWQIILTKTDKITKNALTQQVKKSAETLHLPVANIIPYSSQTHAGREAVWEQLVGYLEPSTD